jgi:hypothetical protein
MVDKDPGVSCIKLKNMILLLSAVLMVGKDPNG